MRHLLHKMEGVNRNKQEVERKVEDKIKRIRNTCSEVQAVLEMDSLFRNSECIITTDGTLLLSS